MHRGRGKTGDGRLQVQLGVFQRVMGTVLVAGGPLTFKEMCVLLDMENRGWIEVRNVLTQVRIIFVIIPFVHFRLVALFSRFLFYCYSFLVYCNKGRIDFGNCHET